MKKVNIQNRANTNIVITAAEIQEQADILAIGDEPSITISQMTTGGGLS